VRQVGILNNGGHGLSKNDPVTRLHRLLTEAQDHQQKSTVKQVWAAVLQLPVDDHAAVLFGVAELIQLVREAKEAVAALDDVETKLLLKPFKKIEAVFSQANLEQSWQQPRSFLDEATMDVLQIGADQVSRVRIEAEISATDLVEITRTVEELMDLVTSSELDQQLKSIVTEQLEQIRNALRSYKIWGSKGLVTALERAAGATVLNHELFDRFGDSAVVKQFGQLLVRIHTTAKVAGGARLLGSGLKGLIDAVVG
jgi:hypothetical protein